MTAHPLSHTVPGTETADLPTNTFRNKTQYDSMANRQAYKWEDNICGINAWDEQTRGRFMLGWRRNKQAVGGLARAHRRTQAKPEEKIRDAQV